VTEERLQNVVDWARAHSPVDDALGRAVPTTVKVSVSDKL
jgi:hypothetical protein